MESTHVITDGDYVTCFNGNEGVVTGMVYNELILQYEDWTINTHLMNVKSINDMLVDPAINKVEYKAGK